MILDGDMMDYILKKRLMWIGAGVFVLVGIVVMIYGIVVPIKIESAQVIASIQQPSNQTSIKKNASRAKQSSSTLQLAELRKLCNKPVFRSLRDLPGKIEIVTDKAAAGVLKISLIGTITETGHSMAVFRMPDNNIEICEQGQTIKDPGGIVKVLKIENLAVTVLFGNKSLILKAPQQPVDDFNYFVTACVK